MKTQRHPTLENKSNSPAHNARRTAATPDSQFADRRPQQIRRGSLQAIVNNSPQVQHLQALQKMANRATIQRVVTEEGGKWKSSRDPLQTFESEAAARQFDGEQPAATHDVIRETVVDKNRAKVTEDVNRAMQRIRSLLLSDAIYSVAAARVLKGKGRDQLIYAPLHWFHSILDLLETWTPTWKIEDTAGLLLDMSNALSKERPFTIDAMHLMNEEMKATRNSSTKKVQAGSELVKSLPPGTKTKAGVSASTALVLQALRVLRVHPLEIEAIMNAIIAYWENSRIKQALGQYHTAVEVWSAYTYHLETYVWTIDEWKRSKL